MTMKYYLKTYGWPTLCGLLLAVLILTASPLGHLFFKADTSASKVLQSPSGLLGQVSFAAAVARAAPSVVNIYSTKKIEANRNRLDSFFRYFLRRRLVPQQRVEKSLGSGVIISPQGYIITALHVIDNADQILVLLSNGKEASAKVVGIDKETDLAVLSLELDQLPAIPIGSLENIQVGDIVLAIGNPFGIGQTVTQGIISGLRRNVMGLGSIEQMIQTDAAINPGNSGGALIDTSGNLLGINTMIASQTGYSIGVGFSTPVDIVVKIVEDIVMYGEVTRGWLGIGGNFIHSEAIAEHSSTFRYGMKITNLTPQGPAYQAGLEVGDIIVEIESNAVVSINQVRQIIVDSKVGSRINMKILRNGNLIAVTAQTIAKPK